MLSLFFVAFAAFGGVLANVAQKGGVMPQATATAGAVQPPIGRLPIIRSKECAVPERDGLLLYKGLAWLNDELSKHSYATQPLRLSRAKLAKFNCDIGNAQSLSVWKGDVAATLCYHYDPLGQKHPYKCLGCSAPKGCYVAFMPHGTSDGILRSRGECQNCAFPKNSPGDDVWMLISKIGAPNEARIGGALAVVLAGPQALGAVSVIISNPTPTDAFSADAKLRAGIDCGLSCQVPA